MAARVARHRTDRPAHWVTVEEPLEIASAVERHQADCEFLLLDCLTLWLSNVCWAHRNDGVDSLHAYASREIARVTTVCTRAHLILVTNEIGCGLVPESALARTFRDLQGWVNQEAARSADWVYQVVAGIPIAIKKPGDGR